MITAHDIAREAEFRRWPWQPTPSYGVYLRGRCLGMVAATTRSRYPGRSKASYHAYPATSDGSVALRSLGTGRSRHEAAELIVDALLKTKHGRKRLGRS